MNMIYRSQHGAVRLKTTLLLKQKNNSETHFDFGALNYTLRPLDSVHMYNMALAALYNVEIMNKWRFISVHQINLRARFNAFKALTVNNAAFWDITPSDSCKYRLFAGMYRLYHKGEKNRRAGNNVDPRSPSLVTLRMERLFSSETSILKIATRLNISESGILQINFHVIKLRQVRSCFFFILRSTNLCLVYIVWYIMGKEIRKWKNVELQEVSMKREERLPQVWSPIKTFRDH
jgi:uncharacterized protein YqgQ